MSNTCFKRVEKRKVTFKMRQKLKVKERALMVYSKCEGNPWIVSTCLNDSKYR